MNSRFSSPFIAWIILIALAVVWGSSFILMKKAMYDGNGAIFSDMQLAALRMFLAFLFMVPFVWKHLKELTGKKWLALLAVGLFGNGIPAFFFAISLTKLDSSFVGMLNSLVPLFTLIIGLAAFRIKVRKLQVVGILVGLAGALGLIFFKGVDTSGNLMQFSGLVIAATICYAISVNVIRNKLHEVNPVVITGIAFMFIGPPTGIYLFTTNFTEVMSTHPSALSALGYTVILAIVGTALAVILFNQLIKMTSGIFAASVTYLIPIVAIFWGFMDGETIYFVQIIWSLVILAGVWLVNYQFKKKKA